jgi:hypothetical protein
VSIRVERFAAVELIAGGADLIGLLTYQTGTDPFTFTFAFGFGRAPLGLGGSCLLRAHDLIRQRVQDKGCAPRLLSDGYSGSRVAVPGESIIDVISLVRILESARRSPRIVFIKKTGLHRRLPVADEREIYHPISSR